jgi:hypothetical protein
MAPKQKCKEIGLFLCEDFSLLNCQVMAKADNPFVMLLIKLQIHYGSTMIFLLDRLCGGEIITIY